MFVTPLFKLMADKQASDLFFTAGAPIQIKINGVVMPINSQVLDPDQVTIEEAMANADSAKTATPEDLSSIKLNLDALD